MKYIYTAPSSFLKIKAGLAASMFCDEELVGSRGEKPKSWLFVGASEATLVKPFYIGGL